MKNFLLQLLLGALVVGFILCGIGYSLLDDVPVDDVPAPVWEEIPTIEVHGVTINSADAKIAKIEGVVDATNIIQDVLSLYSSSFAEQERTRSKEMAYNKIKKIVEEN